MPAYVAAYALVDTLTPAAAGVPAGIAKRVTATVFTCVMFTTTVVYTEMGLKKSPSVTDTLSTNSVWSQ